MKNMINKALVGGLILGGVLTLLPSLAPVQSQNTVIKKLGSFRGNVFPGFAEFRVQQVKFDQMGILSFVTPEPYDLLVNVNYITKVYRFEDAKKTDYSCLMFFSNEEKPLLIRMTYKEVYSAVRKAADAQVK